MFRAFIPSVLLLCVALHAAEPADTFVPFVIPARPGPNAPLDVSARSIPPDVPRVETRDAHFVRDGKPFRVWGVNSSFGANLPADQDARDVAERLPAAGVNSVRLHHLDTNKFPRRHLEQGTATPPGDISIPADTTSPPLVLSTKYETIWYHLTRSE